MPVIPHASLTGADLHEPKGVATAAADTAYLANGSGGGTWKKVHGLASFYSQSTEALSFSTWTRVPFTTQISNTIGITLSNHTFTVPAGTYIVHTYVHITMYYRLRNITDNITYPPLLLNGGFLHFSLTATKNIQVQYYQNDFSFFAYPTVGGESGYSTWIMFQKVYV